MAVSGLCLYLTLGLVGLWYVILAFPDHTCLLSNNVWMNIYEISSYKLKTKYVFGSDFFKSAHLLLRIV